MANLSMEKRQNTARSKKLEWSTKPSCEFLVDGRGGRQFCSYYYNSTKTELGESLNSVIFEDIGLKLSNEEALECGRISAECSPQSCPLLAVRVNYRS